MPSNCSRRSFLQKSALAACGLLLPQNLAEGEMLGRVTAAFIQVRAAPDFNSQALATRRRDELLHLYYALDSGVGRNPRWYRVWGGYVHSAFVQPVETHFNAPLAEIPAPGLLAEVSVPFTTAALPRRPGGWQAINRLYYSSVHFITQVIEGPDGEPWYRIVDSYDRSYCAPAAHLRPIPPEELSPLSPVVPARQKHIEVSISQQMLTAYEGERVVLRTAVSSGIPQKEPPPEGELPTDTPLGHFHITVKTPCRHMGDKRLSDELNSQALPGVPWVCFFHETGLSLHGTYWHANFGYRMSHGCVNLPSPAAQWLYRWTSPVVEPYEQEVSDWGTRVSIYE